MREEPEIPSYQPLQLQQDTAWEADLTPFVNAFPSAYMSGSSVLGVRLSMVYIATASWTNGNPEWNHVNGEMVISSGKFSTAARNRRVPRPQDPSY